LPYWNLKHTQRTRGDVGVEEVEEKVTDGELELRQEESPVAFETLSNILPVRFCESLIAKAIPIPAGTLAAFHINSVDGLGTLSTTAVPPGTKPKIVTGWIAPGKAEKVNGLHCCKVLSV